MRPLRPARRLLLALGLLGLAAQADCYAAPPVYPTPAALAASDASGLSEGSEATVRWQGRYAYTPDASLPPDGRAVFAATPSGRWVRDLAAGFPGATAVPTWWVDGDAGDDANDCTTETPEPDQHGPCGDLAEVLLRIAQQAPPTTVFPVIHVRGDFSGRSYTFGQSASVLLTLRGERRVAAADGTPYPRGTVTAYRPWDGPGHAEGVATVVLDDGTPLDVVAYGTQTGFLLAVVGGDRDGLGVVVGPARDVPGSFATSGGSVPGSYTVTEPAVGDVVQVYRPTPLSTGPGTLLLLAGGPVILQDLEIGGDQHSVAFATLSGPDNGAEVDACVVHGLDVGDASWLFTYGAYSNLGARIYGHLVSVGSTYEGVQSRAGGFAEIGDLSLLTAYGLWLGDRDGPGDAQVDGATCATDLTAPGARAEEGTNLLLTAPFWATRTAFPAIAVDQASTATYTAGNEPACVGACPTAPWSCGGAPAAMLPVTCGVGGIFEVAP